MSRCLIKGLKVHSEKGVIKQGALMVQDTLIEDLFTQEQHQRFCEKNTLHFPANYHLIPGFIDMHIHGSYGFDVMDGTEQALQTICKTLPKEGTTSFLATTMTHTQKIIEQALENIHTASTQGAEILGVHLEGPFLSSKKAGAHQKDLLVDPNIPLFEKWQQLSGNRIQVVTLDPELRGGIDFIQYLTSHQVIASIGHTNASFETALEAIDCGAHYATHLFNAMSPIHQREPGCASASLLHPQLTAELIADGIHLHPAMIHLAYETKKADKLILITDAIRAKGLGSGEYELGGQKVTVSEDRATLENGIIAGSILTMDEAFRNVYHYLKCPFEDMLKMCSSNPAKILGIYDRKGSLGKGKDADLVVLNENLYPVLTFCKGAISFQKDF